MKSSPDFEAKALRRTAVEVCGANETRVCYPFDGLTTLRKTLTYMWGNVSLNELMCADVVFKIN